MRFSSKVGSVGDAEEGVGRSCSGTKSGSSRSGADSRRRRDDSCERSTVKLLIRL
jgi:hypothetical protein